MDLVDQIFNTIINTPSDVIVLVIGSTGVAFLTQITKGLLKIEKNRYAILVAAIISFLASACQYLLTANNLPPEILGVSTALLTVIATPAYHWVIKPLSIALADYREYKDQLKAKAAEVTNQPVIRSGDKPLSAPVISIAPPVTTTVPVDQVVAQPVVPEIEQKPNTVQF